MVVTVPKIAGACNNRRSRLRVMLFPGIFQELSISSRSLTRSISVSSAPAVHSPALERIDIAECAGVSKVEDERYRHGCRGFGHRDESSWEGTSERGAGEYQGEERARWGWVPLRMERSLKGLELKEGRTQPQLAERTARSDGMARGEKGWGAPSRTTQNHIAEGAA